MWQSQWQGRNWKSKLTIRKIISYHEILSQKTIELDHRYLDLVSG